MLLQNDWQPCLIIWIRSKYWLYEEFCIWMCSWLKSKGQALDIFTWARNPIVGQSALVDYNPGWLEPLVLMMKKKSKIMVCIRACGKKLGFFLRKCYFFPIRYFKRLRIVRTLEDGCYPKEKSLISLRWWPFLTVHKGSGLYLIELS